MIDVGSLAETLNRDPFVPLRLHLDDGRRIDIRTSDSTMIFRRTWLYVFFLRPNSRRADDMQMINLKSVAGNGDDCDVLTTLNATIVDRRSLRASSM